MNIQTLPAVRHLGEPGVRGVLRARPEDFEVTEQLGFEPSGDGPHCLIQVEKRDATTLDVIDAVARFAGVRSRDIGYCGLKDRNAVTRQWLSVPYRDGRDWSRFQTPRWRVLHETRNARKLRIGAHSGNAFVLLLRELDGEVDELAARIDEIGRTGVPNYFGPQRFGREGDNLRRARRWFVDGIDLPRRQRRFALSAARSWLFNRVLSERVRRGDWDRFVAGEPACLDGSRSFFLPDDPDDETLRERLENMDVHPSGPLWGKGENPAKDECAQLERDAASTLSWLAEGLAAAGPRQERRALRLAVRQLDYAIEKNVLSIRFELGRGAFATSVVNEIVLLEGLRMFA